MKFQNAVFFILIMILVACSPKEAPKIITITNNLDQERRYETVELTAAFLKVKDLDQIGIKDATSKEIMVTQLVDEDGDGNMDVLLFQTNIGANTSKNYEVFTVSDAVRPIWENWCYSRFVPERTDDYAWENNRVAFRMFGSTAQKMTENGVPGGTLSSGVDAWLKKVEYPIINKWYKKELETDGTYHEDTGEGLDNFHVGVSRGVGGIAIKQDSTYYFSKNYIKSKTITVGPIRTSFYLEIGAWDAGGQPIRESKVISLDYGSNLSKFDVALEGTDAVSAGLTLHEKDGEITTSKTEGWVSYWQPHDGSELGTAIVAAPDFYLGHEKYDVPEKDLSNAYAHLQVKEGHAVYYAGFGWKESGQFNNRYEWEAYLTHYAQRIQTPLEVVVR